MGEPKIYVKGSSAREHVFPNGGKILKLSFKAKELRAFLDEHVNAKGYVNLIVAERREMSQFGDTHSVSLDTWKPKEGGATRSNPPASQPEATDDPPF